MSRMMTRGLLAASVAMAALPLATPASAQATRTWISGVGDDANPCSRTAPCKTFQGAISKTATGGEINCLDPGGFGAVTITKSISLYCEDTINGVLAAGTSGITINGVGINVLLSGFDLEGFGSGINGVRFVNGASLHIRNSNIRDFRGGGFGVSFTPSDAAGATLVLDDVTIIENGATSGVTGGVLVQPGTNVPVSVLVNNSRISDNNRGGVRLDASNAGSSVKAVISGTQITDNQIGVYARSATGGGSVNVALSNTVVSGNTSTGVLAEDALVTINATGNTITHNGNGIRSLTGGKLVTFGDNTLVNNNNNGSFTATGTKQ
ncbi:right-handed parallel beta-helix repeat-containing protein [Sphingopyxis sp. KK2]|uniref:right-handed parallel beta-helix repeat-containing protein n=1 Tax=Sphingopyxis sp. KK2 TaxID=1855727 RepID=UPI001181B00B|nr:right-handed parallel beta-helix repeat-containing protein [Sphingopyxis sp. KK2]